MPDEELTALSDTSPDPNAEFTVRVDELASAIDPDRELKFRDLVAFYVNNFRNGEVPETQQSRQALADAINNDVGFLPPELAGETLPLLEALASGRAFPVASPD